jgi:hypothetical protein
MVDDILFESGEEITEADLRTLLGRAGISGYVESGIGIEGNVDYGNAVTDIGSGVIHVLHNDRDYTVEVDARADKPIATDGTNHVYAHVTETEQPDGSIQLGFEYVINTTATAPAGPSLKVAEIDMSAEEVTELARDAPVASKDATSYKGNDIDPDGDGVVADADHAATADSAASVDGANVSGAVSAAAVADAISSASYDDLVAGDLVHQAGALGETRITIGTGEDFFVQDDTTEDDTFIWRDANRSRLWLGGNDAVVGLQRRIDASGENITNGGLFRFEDAEIHAQGRDDGLFLTTTQSSGEADEPSIVPFVDGNADYSNKLYYLLNQDYWQFESDLRVSGTLNARGTIRAGSNVDALDIGIYTLTPLVDGTRLEGQQFFYNDNTGQWAFETDLAVNADMSANGSYFGLPRVSSDPTGAPNGAEWIRTDLW